MSTEQQQFIAECDGCDCKHSNADDDTFSDHIEPVSFDTINPLDLPFNPSFKCAKSATGQVVKGLVDMMEHVSGTGDHTGNPKEVANDYQKQLYPKLVDIVAKVITRYTSDFVTGVDDQVMRQVFGANLNGNRNNGQLNKFIPCKSVNKFLSYEYVQLGQLLMLLSYRLTFIANRNPEYVKRYVENEVEALHFVELKKRASDFCDFLKNEALYEWREHVNEARKAGGVREQHEEPTGVKLSADNVKRENYSRNYVPPRQQKQYERYGSYNGRHQGYSNQNYNRYPREEQHEGYYQPRRYYGNQQYRENFYNQENQYYSTNDDYEQQSQSRFVPRYGNRGHSYNKY